MTTPRNTPEENPVNSFPTPGEDGEEVIEVEVPEEQVVIDDSVPPLPDEPVATPVNNRRENIPAATTPVNNRRNNPVAPLPGNPVGTAPQTATQPQGSSSKWIIPILIALILVTSCCCLGFIGNALRPTISGFIAPKATSAVGIKPIAPASTPVVAAPTIAAPVVAPTQLPAFPVGETKDGADPANWNKPQQPGFMVGQDGKIVYVQSGKPNTVTITGTVGTSQNLVITAYRLEGAGGTIYDNGIVMVVEGPADMNKFNISITDGAATLVSKESTQTKLDSMRIDFCRGDRVEDGSAWTYKHWALSNIILPEGFTFEKLDTCFNKDADNFPNNPPSKVQ